MTREEFTQAIQAIGTCEDDAERRTLLTNLSDNVIADYELFETTTQQVNDLTSANERLRSANMELFLKVGSKPPEQKSTPTTRKFSDLFNEKGELK